MRFIGALILISLFIYAGLAQNANDQVYLSAIGSYKSTFDKVIYNTSSEIKMGNIIYPEGIKFRSSGCGGNQYEAYFNLDRAYNRLTGLIGLDDKNDMEKVTISLLGDELQLQKITMLNGDLPENVDLDVSGVRRLALVVICEKGCAIDVDLANMVLQKLPQV